MIPFTILSVTQYLRVLWPWMESELNSHVLVCSRCLSKHLNSRVRYSVQWRETCFVVCVFQNGKLKQCVVTLKQLESHKYTHCWVLSRLHGKCLSRIVITAPARLETTTIFNVVAKKIPHGYTI